MTILTINDTWSNGYFAAGIRAAVRTVKAVAGWFGKGRGEIVCGMKLEGKNLVGESCDEMLDHIFECHDELRRLRDVLRENGIEDGAAEK